MAQTLDIALFPLNTVLFPGGLLPLRIFEERYMDMAKECLRNVAPFGVCMIKEGREVGVPALPFDVGCLARIRDWDMPQLGILHVSALGTERFRIRHWEANAKGLINGTVETLPNEAPRPLAPEFAACVRALEAIVRSAGKQILAEPSRYDDAVWVGHRLSEVLPLEARAKQYLLELDDCDERLAWLQRFLDDNGVSVA
jgi:uncharacterized protein